MFIGLEIVFSGPTFPTYRAPVFLCFVSKNSFTHYIQTLLSATIKDNNLNAYCANKYLVQSE